MPAELRLHRRRHLADLERHHRGLELRHHLPGAEPAEIAAVRRRPVARVRLRHLGEVLAAVDLGLQRLGLVLAVDEDVRGVELRRRLERPRPLRHRPPAPWRRRPRPPPPRSAASPASAVRRSFSTASFTCSGSLSGEADSAVGEELLVDELVDEPLHQHVVRQVLVLRRQPVAHGDHVAEGDGGAVDGGEHRRGVVGLGRAVGAGGVLGQHRRGQGQPGHEAGGENAAHGRSPVRALVRAILEFRWGARSGPPLTGAAQPLTSLAG